MGYGSYRAIDWVKLKESRGIHEESSAKTLFKSAKMKDQYNPRYIQMRESCDSADSPESTPIIIGFDVTGSMGYLAEEIAKNSLNKTITNIYDKNPVTNPHVMCAAIGDVGDKAPLQVTQFEADIRILEQLMDLWLEGAGGDMAEDYNLLWYFADRHTRCDAYEKRGKKGFLFTIGDAPVHAGIFACHIMKIFGDEESGKKNQELLQAVTKKYHVFHIVTKHREVCEDWKKILPNHVAYISNTKIGCLSEVITSIMQMTNGMSREAVLAQWPMATREVVREAVKDLKDSTVVKEKGFLKRLFSNEHSDCNR